MALLLNIISKLFLVYMIMIFIRILGSWIPELQRTKFMHFITFYTDPYLNFFRSFIPPLGMIDISPIVAIFCLGFIEWLVKRAIIFVYLSFFA